MRELLPLLCFIVVSTIFAIAAVVVSCLFGPHSQNKNKLKTYECGMPLFSSARIQYNPEFVVYAILFILFEIETIMLFPFAVAFSKLGLFALLETIIFVGIILLGLFYAIKKNLLNWR